MINYQALQAAKAKAAIAKFLGDPIMWREAINQYFIAIGGKAKKH